MKRLFFIFCVCSAGIGYGQSADSLVLDLPTALEIALSENPTVKVADLEIQRVDYVRRETVGNHLPSLSASGQYTFNLIQQEMSKGLSLGADMSASAVGDLSVPLFVPAVYATLRMNKTQKLLAVEQARASRIDLTNAVKKAFYQVLLAENTLEVLRRSEKTIGQTVEDTRGMYSAGLASEYDYLTAEVQLSNLQPNLIAAENAIVTTVQMLKMYLSIPEDVPVKLVGSLVDFEGEVYELPELSADVSENSEVRQLELQGELTQRQIRLANAARLPAIEGYGQIIATGQDKTIDFGSLMTGQGSGVINKWWWQHPATAGFRMSVLFSGFKNTSKVKQLRNSVSQLVLQADYLRDSKRVEVVNSINAIATARATMFAVQKTVGQADKAYTIARTRFEAGAGTMLEVNQAELALTQARLNHSQAIYDYLAAKADYDKITGLNADGGYISPSSKIDVN